MLCISLGGVLIIAQRGPRIKGIDPGLVRGLEAVGGAGWRLLREWVYMYPPCVFLRLLTVTVFWGLESQTHQTRKSYMGYPQRG